jgi:hypothetical protein
MDLQTRIEKLAFSAFVNAMQLSPEDGPFRSVMSVDVDGETKPLLLLGMTHRSFGDGRCTAILNPTPDILEKASPMVGYSKWDFIGKCDMACYQWIITNGEPHVSGRYTYKARKPQPARTVMR